jgi:hypothetical protein
MIESSMKGLRQLLNIMKRLDAKTGSRSPGISLEWVLSRDPLF